MPTSLAELKTFCDAHILKFGRWASPPLKVFSSPSSKFSHPLAQGHSMSSPSGTTRRNGTTSSPKKDSDPVDSVLSESQLPPPTPLSLIIPSPLEILLLALYPSTLLLGSLFSLLNPPARAAPYSALSQSHPPDLAPSYFAQKRNLFNTLFVKIGWFWTTLAFFLFLILHPFTGPPRKWVATPRRLRAVIRWGLVTGWWVVWTQWAFGPGLIDRGFRLTGGACDYLQATENEGSSKGREILTAAACKLAGGQWKGGQDISGHVFLLTLGSAFLALEVLPVIRGYARLREQRILKGREGDLNKAQVVASEIGEHDGSEGEVANSVGGAVVVFALSWFMLFMTAAYFHTWAEKFTGLLVAFVGVGGVYFLPRAWPAFYDFVGMPGV